MRVPMRARIAERIQEARDIFTWHLRFDDDTQQQNYRFVPGQFNMLYLYGVGEVPISIVSDPDEYGYIGHTIRVVGRVTKGMAKLKVGDEVGMRGPFGRGWPLQQTEGKDIIIATGGLGCAPVVGAIHYIFSRRADFGRVVIMQGVKHSNDLLWRESYRKWQQDGNAQVLLAADQAGPNWPWAVGRITALMKEAQFDAKQTIAMMCGPEGMMIAVARELLQRGVEERRLWLSMERNMKCAVGRCGHCQFGHHFVCRNGPVFPYSELQPWLGIKGV